MIIGNRESRRFTLVRHDDVTGVSGTGVVADGVRWPDGTATVRWRGEWPTTQDHDRGIDSAEHIHSHGGSTEIVWFDSSPWSTRLDADLAQVRRASDNVAMARAENCGDKQLLADHWEVQKFVPTLLEELARLRAVVRGDAGGWSMKSVGWLADGDIPDVDLHEWRISLAGIGAVGSVDACAWRLFHERRPGWPTLRHAPNGLPVLVRRAVNQCSCQENGALDNETVTAGAE